MKIGIEEFKVSVKFGGFLYNFLNSDVNDIIVLRRMNGYHKVKRTINKPTSKISEI